MKLIIENTLPHLVEKSNIVADFCLFCAKELPIEGDFKICLTSNRQKYGIVTTASYAVGLNECYIYCKSRAVPDVLRSIAHEMTHMMQDQMGLIVGPIRDAGGFHEDQANAKAGELLKLFVKENNLRDVLYENRLL